MTIDYTIREPRYSLGALLKYFREIVGGAMKASATIDREQFFLDTIEQYGGLISSICRTFANSRTEIDDLRQDALYNIWRGLQSFDHRSQLKTWIYRVTLNTCVSTYRKTSRTPIFAELEHVADISSDESNYESIELLDKMLHSLSSVDRSIIVMWLDDLSYDDIAEVMGMNKNTIATRIRRIRLKLQKLYNNIEK